VDTKPRTWTPHLCQILANFAELAIRAIERAAHFPSNKTPTSPQLSCAMRRVDALDSCVVVVDTGKPGLPLVYANQAVGMLLGAWHRRQCVLPYM
jgi:hypothetical protein